MATPHFLHWVFAGIEKKVGAYHCSTSTQAMSQAKASQSHSSSNKSSTSDGKKHNFPKHTPKNKMTEAELLSRGDITPEDVLSLGTATEGKVIIVAKMIITGDW